MTETVDAIVVGAGQAGPSLAVRLAEAGRRVVLIERERLGGTCVNNGCIPTKTLIASARAAHVARHAAAFGVHTGPVSVDLAAVKARKDAVVQQSRDSLAAWIAQTAHLELVIGEARFVGQRAVAVGARVFEAPIVAINTGGHPVRPDWPAIDPRRVLTNLEMMELGELPRRLIVVGGSYIGLEFAQMYRRFGAELVVLEAADRIIPREDDDVSAAIQVLLEGEGVRFHLGCRDIAGADQGDGVVMRWQSGSGAGEVEGDLVLAAVGRRPNIESLDLAQAGVALDARGFIQVDRRLRTTADGVYALGDVNGRGAFTHTSYNDYEILAANLLDGADRDIDQRCFGYALFTDPPLARVGMSDREARASGRPILRAELPMTRVGRARERGETTGFLRALVDARTEQFLGVTLFGIEADEVVHQFIQAMTAGLTYKALRRAVPVHPTVSELIPTLLAQLRPLGEPGVSQPSPYAIIAQVFDEVRGMDAPLSTRLRLLADAVRNGSPRFADAVETLVARLQQAGLGRNAPQVGETMPPFMLPDQDRRLVALPDMLASGPAVISFHRGHWCPYCQLTASAVSKVQERIGRPHIVAITPETRTYNARLIEGTGIGYRVLTDPDSGYALSINLAFWLDDAFAELMRSVGQNLAAYQARGAWVLPVPATFVVGQQGKIVARHVDPDYRHRMEVEDLVAAFERALQAI